MSVTVSPRTGWIVVGVYIALVTAAVTVLMTAFFHDRTQTWQIIVVGLLSVIGLVLLKVMNVRSQ